MTLGMEIIWLLPTSIIFAIVLAIFLIRDVLRRDSGTEAMVAVSGKIYEGAIAFLRRQYSTIGILAIITAIIIGTLIALFDRYIEVSGVSPL